jgi:hypothetical protein
MSCYVWLPIFTGMCSQPQDACKPSTCILLQGCNGATCTRNNTTLQRNCCVLFERHHLTEVKRRRIPCKGPKNRGLANNSPLIMNGHFPKSTNVVEATRLSLCVPW